MPDFGILGPLLVRDQSGALDVPGRRRRALLIRLLASANQPVTPDQLIEDVWDGRPPPGASQTLQSHISALRRLLGGSNIHNSTGGYSIEVECGDLDSTAFEAERAEGLEAYTAGDLQRGNDLLTAALARWRGTALSDVADFAWSLPVRTRLDELRLTSLETRYEALLGLGKNEEVVVSAEAAVVEQPLREGLWYALMLSLYRCGRQVEALRAYERLRRSLAELGITPSPTLSSLEEAILEQSAELDWHPQEPRSESADLDQTRRTADAQGQARVDIPAGTVTLLFTDIEGSTRMWEQHASAMSAALKRHDQLIRTVLVENSGYVFKTMGDAFCTAFASSSSAVQAAVALQRAVWNETWPESCDIRIRVALHSGECEERDGDYFGPTVNRVARVYLLGPRWPDPLVARHGRARPWLAPG